MNSCKFVLTKSTLITIIKLPQRSTYPSKACSMQTLLLESAMFTCDILDIFNFQTVMTQVATYLFVILMFLQMVIEVIPSFRCVATSNKQTKLLENYCFKHYNVEVQIHIWCKKFFAKITGVFVYPTSHLNFCSSSPSSKSFSTRPNVWSSL